MYARIGYQPARCMSLMEQLEGRQLGGGRIICFRHLIAAG